MHQDDGEPDQVQGQDGRDVEERRGAGVGVDHLRGCAIERNYQRVFCIFKRFWNFFYGNSNTIFLGFLYVQ